MSTEPHQFPSVADKKKVASKDFRTIAVSSIGANANENLIQLTFGLEIADPENDQENIILEEVRLVMTPRTLKLVQMVCTSIVGGLESALGEIMVTPLPPTTFQKNK